MSCRACFTAKHASHSLSRWLQPEKMSLKEMLREVCDVPVEGAPDRICDSCLDILKSAHAFRTMCKKTHLRLTTTTVNIESSEKDLVESEEDLGVSEEDLGVSEEDLVASEKDLVVPEKDNEKYPSKRILPNSRSVQLKFKWLCTKCKFSCSGKKYLDEHMAIHLADQRRLAMTRLVKSQLKKDIPKSASKTKRHMYSCKKCVFACDTKDVFSTHMTRHNEDKPRWKAAVSFLNEHKELLDIANKPVLPRNMDPLQDFIDPLSVKQELLQPAEVETSALIDHYNSNNSISTTKTPDVKSEEITSPAKETKTRQRKQRDFSRTKKKDNKIHSAVHNLKIISYDPATFYRCDKCLFVVDSQERLDQHVNAMHVKIPPPTLTCDKCQKVFKTKQALAVHSQTHSGKVWVCDDCGKSLKSKTSLRIHVGNHAAVKRFECDTCSAKFKQKPDLVRHLLSHSDDRKYVCDQCGHGCKRVGDLQDHKIRHTTDRKYVCGGCSFTCKLKRGLVQHQKLCKGKDNIRSFRCPTCNLGYASTASLEKHTAKQNCRYTTTALSGRASDVSDQSCKNRCHVCPLCPYACVQRGVMDYHMRMHFIGAKNVCGLCGYATHKRAMMTKHKLTHDRRTYTLKTAVKSKHVCRKCTKAFKYRWQLSQHEETCYGSSEEGKQPTQQSTST